MMRETVMYCHKYASERLPAGFYFNHFSTHPKTTNMHDEKEQILEVLVKESEETRDSYWGWFDNTARKFKFVYVTKSLVEMCFPYGAKAEEERGRGFLLPVSVTVLKN